MSALHLYSNGVDFIVARDSQDAMVLRDESYGEGDPENMVFTLIDGSRELRIKEDDGTRVSHTASEWVDVNGRGFLGSTEN